MLSWLSQQRGETFHTSAPRYSPSVVLFYEVIMAKDEKKRQQTAFFNIKLPEWVWWSVEPDCPQTEVAIFTEFAELSEDGVKVSFGAKKDRNGYAVSVTLPEVGVAFDAVCCSFWGGERYEAWSRAYAVVFVFGAGSKGWDLAQDEIDKCAKKLKEDMAALRLPR